MIKWKFLKDEQKIGVLLSIKNRENFAYAIYNNYRSNSFDNVILDFMNWPLRGSAHGKGNWKLLLKNTVSLQIVFSRENDYFVSERNHQNVSKSSYSALMRRKKNFMSFTCNRVFITSAGVTRDAAGIPAIQPAASKDNGLLYPVSSANFIFVWW